MAKKSAHASRNNSTGGGGGGSGANKKLKPGPAVVAPSDTSSATEVHMETDEKDISWTCRSESPYLFREVLVLDGIPNPSQYSRIGLRNILRKFFPDIQLRAFFQRNGSSYRS